MENVRLLLSNKDGKPFRIHTVFYLISMILMFLMDRLKEELNKRLSKLLNRKKLLDDKTIYLINPTGRFVAGGPMADTGLTG
jgi:S-adenosylmethionine synthetase